MSLLNLVFDALIFLQRAETLGLDPAVVRKQICAAVIRLYEPNPFVSLNHFTVPVDIYSPMEKTRDAPATRKRLV